MNAFKGVLDTQKPHNTPVTLTDRIFQIWEVITAATFSSFVTLIVMLTVEVRHSHSHSHYKAKLKRPGFERMHRGHSGLKYILLAVM